MLKKLDHSLAPDQKAMAIEALTEYEAEQSRGMYFIPSDGTARCFCCAVGALALVAGVLDESGVVLESGPIPDKTKWIFSALTATGFPLGFLTELECRFEGYDDHEDNPHSFAELRLWVESAC